MAPNELITAQGNGIKKKSRYKSGSLFDNPKTNLTYEKNLYIF
jgi:hypothetical protein